MHLRPETPADFPIVREILAAAFETPAEAGLVEILRREVEPLVSLVAEVEGEVVGHILFTPVTLPGHPDLPLMGLAPMAVTPHRQRGGIGSSLVWAGLEACRELGAVAVVVLGHPEYYPKFGFVPSKRFGIQSEYPVPEEVFMAMELKEGALEPFSGTVQYHPAFASAAL